MPRRRRSIHWALPIAAPAITPPATAAATESTRPTMRWAAYPPTGKASATTAKATTVAASTGPCRRPMIVMTGRVVGEVLTQGPFGLGRPASRAGCELVRPAGLTLRGSRDASLTPGPPVGGEVSAKCQRRRRTLAPMTDDGVDAMIRQRDRRRRRRRRLGRGARRHDRRRGPDRDGRPPRAAAGPARPGRRGRGDESGPPSGRDRPRPPAATTASWSTRLARDHLVDYPDSLIVAWIASDAVGRARGRQRP